MTFSLSLSLRTWRRRRWMAWVQLMCFFGWTLSAPMLNAVYIPAAGFDLQNPATWTPVWHTDDPVNNPEPAGGPDETDLDSDGLPRWFEEWYEMIHAPAWWAMGTMHGTPDSDDDGVTDADEILGSPPSDPFDAYSLGAELSDATPVTDGQYLAWLHTDTDTDGLSDWAELTVHATDPQVPDTDGDDWLDGDEVAAGFNPLLADSDGDGIGDLDDHLADVNPSGDQDGDGLSNSAEITVGTLVRNADTDGDGLLDGYELKTQRNGESKAASDPLNPRTDSFTIDSSNTMYLFPSDCPQALSMVTTTLPVATAGQDYSTVFHSANASGTETWSIIEGSLPEGFTLEGGVLAGNHGTPGVFHFTVQVADDYSAASADFTLTVMAPSVSIVSDGTLPEVQPGSGVSWQFAASGGGGGYAWSAPHGLPEGLDLAQDGTLSGAVAGEGQYAFTVRVIAADGGTAQQQVTLPVVSIPPPPMLEISSSPTLSDAQTGGSYTWQFTASGGSGSYSWQVTAGSLPAGLSLASDGQLTGVAPSAPGVWNFTVGVSDGSYYAYQSVWLTVVDTPPPGLMITTGSSLTASAWTPVLLALECANPGGGTLHWSSSNLPSGLSIHAQSGELSGTLREPGTLEFEVTVSDGFSSDSKTFVLSAVDQDADGDGLLASQEHELALRTSLPVHDAHSHSNGQGPHDWLVYYHTFLISQDQYDANGGTLDTDGDGLGPMLEAFLGTQEGNPDSDGDFRPDWWQRYLTYDQYFNARDPNGRVIDQDRDALPQSLEGHIGSSDDFSWGHDSDGDGLGDAWEWQHSSFSDITQRDTDGDGLHDSQEYLAGTHARWVDSDGDHLTDREEIEGALGIVLDPLNPDTDGDGFPDWTEVDLTDSDGAGIPDRLETFWGMNPADPLDEADDYDNDGQTNVAAYLAGWDIHAQFDPQYDRDHDGMTNVWELARDLDPDDIHDGGDDPDSDWLTNVEEFEHRTSHLLALTPAASVLPDGQGGMQTIPVWENHYQRPVINDFEIAFRHPLNLHPVCQDGETRDLVRDNGPLHAREFDDDWDSDGIINVDELYPPTGRAHATDPRAWNAPLQPVHPPQPVTGQPYDAVLAATGGVPPYQFTLEPGASLPAWLTKTGNRLHGQAPATPLHEPPFTLRVTDARGFSDTMQVCLQVGDPPPVFAWITPEDLGTIHAGAGSFATVLGTTGAIGQVTFAETSVGSGWSLGPSGEASFAFPSDPVGVHSFTATATDESTPPRRLLRTFTLTITPTPDLLLHTTNADLAGIKDDAYSATLSATASDGGTCTLSVITLPPGLHFDPHQGRIHGTPTAVGTTPLSITVTSGAASQTFERQIVISASALKITTEELPNAQLGHQYLNVIESSGGTGARTVSLLSGTLPPGLTLSAGGYLSGAPQQDGLFTFTVKVTDEVPVSVQKTFTLRVPPPPPRLSLTIGVPRLTAIVGVPLNIPYTVENGVEPYTVTVTPVTFWATGRHTATVIVTDATGAQASDSVEVEVDVLTLSASPATQFVMQGAPATVTFTANDGFTQVRQVDTSTLGQKTETLAYEGLSATAQVMVTSNPALLPTVSISGNAFVPQPPSPVVTASSGGGGGGGGYFWEHLSISTSQGAIQGSSSATYYHAKSDPPDISVVHNCGTSFSRSGTKWNTSDPDVQQQSPDDPPPPGFGGMDDWSPGAAGASRQSPPDGPNANVAGVDAMGGCAAPAAPWTYLDLSTTGHVRGVVLETRSRNRVRRAPGSSTDQPITVPYLILTETLGPNGQVTGTAVTSHTIGIGAGQQESAPIDLTAANNERKRLLPIEVKVVNRDDPTKTWTTGPVTSGPLAYTSPTISEVSDVKNGDLISWSVPGLTGGSFQWWATGPSGSRKDAPSSVTSNEWKLEDPLDWLPGKWRIHCRYTPSGGAATEFDFEQNLGYRSPDITVIGWIDGAQIILPSGADKPLLRTWPSGTYPSPWTVETWMSTLPTRMTFLGEVALGDVYTVPLAPDPARKYVNAYLIKSSPNNAPPAEFQLPWPGFENRKMVDDAGFTQFKSQTDKFRSFHRFQARFELDDSGKIKGAPHYLKQATQVGVTPVDWLPDPAGETGPHDGTVNTTGASIQFNPKNGRTHSAKLADDFEQYTQGRISTSGMMSGGHISQQLNNLKVPWIWSLIEFGAAHAKAGSTATPEHEIFPVYHVYYNGKRIDTLTNSISEAKMEEFIQLGEPNVP